jgi:hypothetical protein
MKTAKLLSTLIAILAFSFNLSSQNTDQTWYIVDYMKTKPDMASKYLECEQAWKAIHADRIKKGIIQNWELFAVNFPAGANTEYDYVTVTSVKSGWQGFGKLYNSWNDDYLKLVPKEKQALVQNTESYRTLVKTEVLSLMDFVFPKENKPFKYCMVNYFDVPDGHWDEYYSMETKLVKPVQQLDVDNGKRIGWLLNSVAIPSAHDTHDAVTVDLYDSWDNVGNSTEGAWKKIHPDMSEEYIGRQIEGTRKMVKREMWQLLDSL